MRLARSWSAALAVLLLLAACGSDTGEPTADDPPTAPTAMPTEVPVPDGPVTTTYAATVLDDGDGAELCLGGVATSLPPQCGGPNLLGWDWSDHVGDFEDVSGTKWGDFAVTGTFDGRDLTPTDVVPADEFEAPDYPESRDFSTPCPEPDGAWPVPNASDNTIQGTDRAFRRAQRLDGYAGSWVDTSRDQRSPEEVDQDAADGNDDVSLWIINVRVTGDTAAAEEAIREVWSGAVCVTKAEHTEAELRRIQREVNELPGMLTSGGGDQQVEVGVIYDDGSIQAWLDKKYGPGLVVVWSALTPVE
jgi:hypothetical protein